MTKNLLAGVALAAMLTGCATVEEGPAPATAAALPQASGYFAEPSALPFHAPDFTKFNDADLQPAIEQGIAITRAEIDAIANNAEPATFENTLVAMERAGQMLGRANAVLNQLTSANTNDALDAAQAAVAPQLTALDDYIYLNDKLFQRVKAVYDNRAAMSMTPEDAMLLETVYADFVHAGALLDDERKAVLKQMNTRIADLETQFSQKLTEATAAKAPVFDTREELAGLTDAQIEASAKLATEMGQSGKFALALINTTQQPMLTSLTNRETRRRLFEASVNRASGGDEHDLTAIIEELAALRARKAGLLGLPNFATYAMYDRMVTIPRLLASFLLEDAPGALPLPLSMGLLAAEMGMNLQVALGWRRHLLLHASAVARDGRALIMSGESGSGKSTLAALLGEDDWRLMGDEFTLIDPAGGDAFAFPRAVSPRHVGACSEIAQVHGVGLDTSADLQG